MLLAGREPDHVTGISVSAVFVGYCFLENLLDE
jgi:hypothetical protein